MFPKWTRFLLYGAGLLVFTEALLTLGQRLSASPIFPSPVFAGGRTSDEAVRDALRRSRYKPHAQRFDRKLNSGGFVDDEPFVAEDRDLVVAVLADSFGVGVVPFAYNFATVAEWRLRHAIGGNFARVAVHNFGVAGVGLPEHFYLMRTEALPTSPSLVVLCLFVGNDIEPGLGSG